MVAVYFLCLINLDTCREAEVQAERSFKDLSEMEKKRARSYNP